MSFFTRGLPSSSFRSPLRYRRESRKERPVQPVDTVSVCEGAIRDRNTYDREDTAASDLATGSAKSLEITGVGNNLGGCGRIMLAKFRLNLKLRNLTRSAVKVGNTENINRAALGVAVEARVAETARLTTVARSGKDGRGHEGNDEGSELHFDGSVGLFLNLKSSVDGARDRSEG